MSTKNGNETRAEIPVVRITRSRAKTLGTSSGALQPSRPSFKQVQKRGILMNAKRATSDENKVSAAGDARLQHKRQAVLKDVTNTSCDNVLVNHVKAAKTQVGLEQSY